MCMQDRRNSASEFCDGVAQNSDGFIITITVKTLIIGRTEFRRVYNYNYRKNPNYWSHIIQTGSYIYRP